MFLSEQIVEAAKRAATTYYLTPSMHYRLAMFEDLQVQDAGKSLRECRSRITCVFMLTRHSKSKKFFPSVKQAMKLNGFLTGEMISSASFREKDRERMLRLGKSFSLSPPFC